MARPTSPPHIRTQPRAAAGFQIGPSGSSSNFPFSLLTLLCLQVMHHSDARRFMGAWRHENRSVKPLLLGPLGVTGFLRFGHSGAAIFSPGFSSGPHTGCGTSWWANGVGFLLCIMAPGFSSRVFFLLASSFPYLACGWFRHHHDIGSSRVAQNACPGPAPGRKLR